MEGQGSRRQVAVHVRPGLNTDSNVWHSRLNQWKGKAVADRLQYMCDRGLTQTVMFGIPGSTNGRARQSPTGCSTCVTGA